MNDFDDFADDEIDLTAPLHLPSVIIGLTMMISGFLLPIFLEDQRLKILCLIMLCLSFWVMTKRQPSDSDLP